MVASSTSWACPPPYPKGGAGELARFGIALAKRRDRVFGGSKITVRREARRKHNVYSLVSTSSTLATAR